MLGNIDLQGIGATRLNRSNISGDFFSGGGGLILAVVAGFALLLISKPDKTGSAQTPKLSAIEQIEALRPKS